MTSAGELEVAQLDKQVDLDTDLLFYRGRVALFAILKGLGVGDGDHVALQAFTCVAVPEAIMAAGARPIYIDIEASGFNMDANDLQKKLTPRVRAIIVQHTYGIPANMDPIVRIANAAGLPIIEDCCHTFFSTYKGRTVGSFGVASFYSYEWGKPVVLGIGGSAVINDPGLREKVRDLYQGYRFPGLARQVRILLQFIAFKILYNPMLYWPVRSLFHWLGSLGVAESNYNPIGKGDVADDFSLRMPKNSQQRLKRKIKHVPALTQHARWIAGEYEKRIRSSVISHVSMPDQSDIIFARYPLIVNRKNELLVAARQANIELSDWYTLPIHPVAQKDWSLIHYQAMSCPNAEERCRQVVTLPVNATVRKLDIDRTIRFMDRFN